MDITATLKPLLGLATQLLLRIDTGLAFGDLLRRHRMAAGLTQDALAERAGLSLRGVSDLERGARQVPYRETVLRLANALGLGDSERQELLACSCRCGLRAGAAGASSVAARGRPGGA